MFAKTWFEKLVWKLMIILDYTKAMDKDNSIMNKMSNLYYLTIN